MTEPTPEQDPNVVDIRPVLTDLIGSPLLPTDIRTKLVANGTADALSWASANPTLSEEDFGKIIEFTGNLHAVEGDTLPRNANQWSRHQIGKNLLSNDSLPMHLVPAALSFALDGYSNVNTENLLAAALAHPNLDPEVYAQFFRHAMVGDFDDLGVVHTVFSDTHLETLLYEKSNYLVPVFRNPLLYDQDPEDVKLLLSQHFEDAYLPVIKEQSTPGWALEHLFGLIGEPETKKGDKFTNGVHLVMLLEHPNTPDALRTFSDTNYGAYSDQNFLSRDNDSGEANYYPLRDLSVPGVVAVQAQNTPDEILRSIVSSGQEDACYELLCAPVTREESLLLHVVDTYNGQDILGAVAAHKDATEAVLSKVAEKFLSYFTTGSGRITEDTNQLLHHLVLNPVTAQSDVDEVEKVFIAKGEDVPVFQYRRNGFEIVEGALFSPNLYRFERLTGTIGHDTMNIQDVGYAVEKKWLRTLITHPGARPPMILALAKNFIPNSNFSTEDWRAFADMIGLS